MATLDYDAITALLAAHKPTLELTDYGALTHRGAAGCLGPQLCETAETGETYAAQFVMWNSTTPDKPDVELRKELLEVFVAHWPDWCDKNGFAIWHAGQSRFGRTDCPFHDPSNEVAVIWRSVASNQDAAAALIALLATPARWPEENIAFL
jgi:hypothetical protein